MANDGERSAAGDGRQKGSGVRVAIVDSGIRTDHPSLPRPAGGVLIGNGRSDPQGLPADFDDPVGHGTACAGIVHSIAPGAALYAVRVLADDLTASAEALAAALDWVAEQRMDVASLSLGTTDGGQEPLLAHACWRALEAGTILVAARHWEGRRSLPAALPDVISVGARPGLGQRPYAVTDGDDPEIVARGDRQRVCWAHPDHVLLEGTSFAAPRVSGLVALIRQELPGAPVAEVRRQLRLRAPALAQAAVGGTRARAVAGWSPPGDQRGLAVTAAGLATVCASGAGSAAARSASRENESPAPRTGRWLGRAVLYPFNKEIHALVRGRDLLSFTIAAVVDPVGKGLVGQDAGASLGLPPAGLPVQANLRAALEQADGLVLGCVDRLGQAERRDALRDALTMALGAGKHVFSLMPVPADRYPDLHELAARTGAILRWPDVAPERVAEVVRAGDLAPEVAVPVLGVCGTSSRQGKFTLQLELRARLLARGYTVAQIGTEPHAELFGMDLVFPTGYGSPLRVPLQAHVPFLRASMRLICSARRPDIVLVGSQSGTVPYAVERQETHTLPTLAFLLGTQPDACVLVVNASDPDGLVQDTLDTLRAVARAPAILLALADHDLAVRSRLGRTAVGSRRLSQVEVHSHCQRLEGRFGVPAACIAAAEDLERATRVILDYFGAEPALAASA